MLRLMTVTLLLVLAVSLSACGPPSGDTQASEADTLGEVAVVTSGGLAAAYDALAPRFQDETGIRLVTAYGASTGGAPTRSRRGWSAGNVSTS